MKGVLDEENFLQLKKMEEKMITQKKWGKQIDRVYLRVTYDMG